MPYVAGSNVAQDTPSTIGKMLSVSVQNSHRISVKNTSAGIYDSGFLPLEEMVSGPVPPTSRARHAPGTLTANQLLLGDFFFSNPFEPLTSEDTQSIKCERLLRAGIGYLFLIHQKFEGIISTLRSSLPSLCTRKVPLS